MKNNKKPLHLLPPIRMPTSSLDHHNKINTSQTKHNHRNQIVAYRSMNLKKLIQMRLNHMLLVAGHRKTSLEILEETVLAAVRRQMQIIQANKRNILIQKTCRVRAIKVTKEIKSKQLLLQVRLLNKVVLLYSSN